MSSSPSLSKSKSATPAAHRLDDVFLLGCGMVLKGDSRVAGNVAEQTAVEAAPARRSGSTPGNREQAEARTSTASVRGSGLTAGRLRALPGRCRGNPGTQQPDALFDSAQILLVPVEVILRVRVVAKPGIDEAQLIVTFGESGSAATAFSSASLRVCVVRRSMRTSPITRFAVALAGARSRARWA